MLNVATKEYVDAHSGGGGSYSLVFSEFKKYYAIEFGDVPSGKMYIVDVNDQCLYLIDMPTGTITKVIDFYATTVPTGFTEVTEETEIPENGYAMVLEYDAFEGEDPSWNGNDSFQYALNGVPFNPAGQLVGAGNKPSQRTNDAGTNIIDPNTGNFMFFLNIGEGLEVDNGELKATGGGGGGGAPACMIKYSVNPTWASGTETKFTVAASSPLIDSAKYYKVDYTLNGYFTTKGNHKALLVKLGSSVIMNMPFGGFADGANFSYFGSAILLGAQILNAAFTMQLQGGDTAPVTTMTSGQVVIMEVGYNSIPTQ